MLGGDAVGWGEVEAPISFPTGYMEAWRYSSTEELELTGFDGGLQGHGLVQLSSKHRAHCDMALHNSSGDRVLVEPGSRCCKQWYLSPEIPQKPKSEVFYRI